MRLMCHDLPGLEITEAADTPSHAVDFGTTTEVISVGTITSLVVNDEDEEASGMLVEGVVRASGLRLHMHRGWGADESRDTDIDLPNSELQVELDGKSIVVGNGLVLGRWPYSHPEFDDSLEPLILSDPAVSRLHAVLLPTPTGLSFVDRGSHNGSWVIRQSGKSTRAYPDAAETLLAGDQIRVGDTVLQVQ